MDVLVNKEQLQDWLDRIEMAVRGIDAMLDPQAPPPPPQGGLCREIRMGESGEIPGHFWTTREAADHCYVKFDLPRAQYSAVRVAFTVRIPTYNDVTPGKTHYVLAWLQLGAPTKWSKMLAYLLSVPSRSRVRFSSNVEVRSDTVSGRRMLPGTYRVEISYLRGGAFEYSVQGIDNTLRARGVWSASHDPLEPGPGTFLSLGNQYHVAGPEAITDGFEFSDLKVTWTP